MVVVDGRPVQGPPGGPQGRPPLCGQRGRPGLPGRCLFQGTHRGGHPLRRLLPGGREHAGARTVFPQQRHCRADPHRDHAGPQGAYLVFSSTATFGEPVYVPIDEATPEPHQPLRREQAHRGEDAQVVRPGPRPQVLRPALLQRGRSLARRLHRRGSPAGEPPDPPHPPGGPGQAGAALPLRHRLPHQGRHLYPGLHPRGGSHRRPLPGPGLPEAHQHLRRLQPGQRAGLLQPGDHRGRPPGHRPPPSPVREEGRRPRRPRATDRLQPEGHGGAGLATAPMYTNLEDIIAIPPPTATA